MNKIISISNLCKSYTSGNITTKVLEDITLDIYENQIIFIIGPSGAGKTTLLNILGLMDGFDSGDYILLDKNTKTMTYNNKTFFIRNYIGFLFQVVPLLKELNVYNNILLPAKVKNKMSIKKDEVYTICEKLGIVDLLKRKITQISTGQRQRVAIASVLLKKPKILFCDEPTANLDNKNTENILQLLNDINKTYGITIVFATHNLALSKFATKTYKISYGKFSEYS